MISNMLRAFGDSKTPLYFLVLRRPEFRRRQNEAHPHGRACLHDRACHAACRHRLAVLVQQLFIPVVAVVDELLKRLERCPFIFFI